MNVSVLYNLLGPFLLILYYLTINEGGLSPLGDSLPFQGIFYPPYSASIESSPDKFI
jgi:hypothetical protein